jgi:hypothetical protein
MGAVVSVLLVVFDGLRPDMIRAETTPNLMRFAAMATSMPRARSVFPSETRVCTSSIATGCYPRRHGLVANRMPHPTRPERFVDTGNALALREMEQEIGGPTLLVPGLSDLLAGAHQDFAVFSSGTTGQCRLLAPNADTHGQMVISAHGPQHCSAAGRQLLSRLEPAPVEPAARAVWIADAWRTTMLAAPPAASVLWLCEPDTAAHYQGLDSPGQRAALMAVDAAFGRLLDDWQAGVQHDQLQIIVASDHGHVTVDGLVPAQAMMAESPVFAGCGIGGGGIVVPDGDRVRIAEIARFLMRQDWVASVFTPDLGDIAAGTLPHSVVMLDHPRTAHVLYTLRNTAKSAPSGLVGTTLLDSAMKLGVGAGWHGGLNSGELSTVLMLAGSKIRSGVSSDWPAGLVDIAPTILALLGLLGDEAMDGRVIGEALLDGQEPSCSRSPETWEASGEFYAQRVARTRVGRHVWIERGERI